MISKEIKKLKSQGVKVTKIASILGISRETVYCNLNTEFRKKANLRKLKVRLRAREFIKRYKAFVGCSACGIKNPIVLEFDHVRSKDKKYDVSSANMKSCSIQKLKQEIRKCDVLCSNCHKIKTYNERNHHKNTDSHWDGTIANSSDSTRD